MTADERYKVLMTLFVMSRVVDKHHLDKTTTRHCEECWLAIKTIGGFTLELKSEEEPCPTEAVH